MARFNPITSFERREDITPERLNELITELGNLASAQYDTSRQVSALRSDVSAAISPSPTPTPGDLYAIYRDVQIAGTNGGTLTAGWNTRVFNTFQVNAATAYISAASELITLQAGTYHISASAPASMVGLHQLRIYSTTSSSTLLLGTSEWCGAVNTRAYVEGVLTFSGATTIRLDHWVQNTVATTGGGVAADNGEVEVYAQMTIFKL